MPKSIHVSFLLVPGFMLSAFALFTDALRLANWRNGQDLFNWDIRSPDGNSVTANDGTVLSPSSSLFTSSFPKAVFVAAGFSPEQAFTREVFSLLKTADRERAILGGWDTGPLVLAEAGLMGGRAMALHWQAIAAVQDRYSNVQLYHDRLAITKRRFTGPGGVSTFDLAIEFIEQCAGSDVAQMVAGSANRHVESSSLAPQGFRANVGGRARRAVALMEGNINSPITMPELASRLGVSQRSLNRMFHDQFDKSPQHYYLNLRLYYAANLLRQSNMKVLEIAVLSGFNSAARFSQAFRKQFGCSPSDTRRQASWMRIEPSQSREKMLTTLEDNQARFDKSGS